MDMGRKPRNLRTHPSFFQVLIGDFSNNLKIPAAFVNNFDGKTPRKALLWSPANRYWSVSVESVNKKLYFQEGWKSFVEDNSLENGDFVVFYYTGKSEFYVELYGKNCCQKKLVTTVKKSDMRQKVAIDLEAKKDQIVQGDSKLGSCSKEEAKEKEARIVEEAEKYISKLDDPYFKAVMRKAYVENRYLNIPLRFFESCMRNKGMVCELQASEKLWPAKILYIKRKTSVARLSTGWYEFVTGNSIKVGDVCVFEALERDGLVIKVSIFRCE